MSEKFCYDYPRPSVTSDCVIFRIDGGKISVLLIKRINEPFRDMWAFPGGFLDMDETIEECAHRELKEETGIENLNLEQFGVFSALGRDPRGRTIAIAFFGIADTGIQPVADDDASEARWFSLEELPPLAFDHNEILRKAVPALEKKLCGTGRKRH